MKKSEKYLLPLILAFLITILTSILNVIASHL